MLATSRLDLVGDVLEVVGLHLLAHLAAAPRLEDVRRVVAQQRGGEPGALELVGLDRLDLDLDGRVQAVEKSLATFSQ